MSAILRQEVARWISIVGHPFVFVVLVVGLTTWKLDGAAQALRLTAIFLLVAVVPLWIFMWRKRRSGRWRTIDASDKRDRPALYAMSLLPLALVTAYLLLAERAGYMVRGCLAIATLILAAAIVNRWIKLSNHMAVASFAAIIFYQLWPMTVFALVVVIPLLAWSRVVLARHTIREVLGGILLGALVAEVLLRT